MKYDTYTRTAIAVLLFAVANLAHSQSVLEEVVVTAQKRSQSLQDVPISINVVSGQTLRENGITQMDTLAPTVPNFHFSEAISSTDNMWIRGVGSGINLGFEQAVGQVIDGFFFGRSRFGRASFLDLERIEILKGPQGALLGKNTTAGAINITTAKPTDEFESWITGTYEFQADKGVSVEGAVSGPLTDTLRARIAARYDDREGWVRNIATGKDEQQKQDVTIRGILEWDASDKTDVTLSYQYGDFDRVGRTREYTDCSDSQRAFIADNGIEENCRLDYTRNSLIIQNGVTVPQIFNTTFDNVGLTINWQLGDHTLTSLTGYMQYEFLDIIDSDLLPIEQISGDDGDNWSQWTQELRLTSEAGGKVEYIVGAFFMDTEQDSFLDIDFQFLPPVARATRIIQTHQEGNTAAIFGQLTWNISDQWSTTVSGRYTRERKEARQEQFPAILYTRTRIDAGIPFGPAAPEHEISQQRKENDFSPTFNLSFRPDNDVMLYANVGQGFKGGGFDQQLSAPQATANDAFQFEEENVTAYELGAKWAFAGGSAEATVALFRSEFDQLQVSTIGENLTFNVGNAASAISEGIEANIRWNLSDNLTLSSAIAILDSTFDKYPDAPCYFGQTVAEGCIDPDGAGPAISTQDLGGKTLQFAPQFAFSGSASYVRPFSNGLQLRGFLQGYYKDRVELALDLDPFTFQSSFFKVDASLALANSAYSWEIALIGRNLTDEITKSFANDQNNVEGGGHYGLSDPPRSLALQATFRFE